MKGCLLLASAVGFAAAAEFNNNLVFNGLVADSTEYCPIGCSLHITRYGYVSPGTVWIRIKHPAGPPSTTQTTPVTHVLRTCE